jgi:hypothetical protein
MISFAHPYPTLPPTPLRGEQLLEDGHSVTVAARVAVLGTAFVHRERYLTGWPGGLPSTGRLRRDAKPGRAEFRGWATAAGELVLL